MEPDRKTMVKIHNFYSKYELVFQIPTCYIGIVNEVSRLFTT